MNFIYIVIENGEPYLFAYTNFHSASQAVKEKYNDTIEDQIKECGDDICSEIDLPENKLTNITHLYVEKGINIQIYKLPVISF
jgi:hypothetical protein